jgi:hypothetical protein
MSNAPNCEPTAGASGEPDPIFAAIERHRAALGSWLAAYDRLGVLQEMISEDRRRWRIFDERPDDCSDALEWIEANTIFLAAVEESAKALEVVLSTPPTTITGVADLLDYVGRYECQPLAGQTILESARDGHGPVRPVSKRTYEGVKNAAANFLPMIAATLPRRGTGEPVPIFAAIEQHRAALRGWAAAKDRRWRLRQMIPEAGRRWESGERPHFCTDAPEWIGANTALIEAYEELDKALEVVLSIPPTTVAGVADLLDYVSKEEWEVAGAVEDSGGEWYGTILENALEGDHDQGLVENPACTVEAVRKAATNFLPMIAATLRTLTAGPS